MPIKMGDYEIVVKKGEEELQTLPGDLPVFDFDGNQITYEEAKGGYLRQSDYSKKTAEVAELKKLFTDLGVQDPRRGVGIIRQLLGTVAELEDAGVLDPNTGEILYNQGEGGGEPDPNKQNQLSPEFQRQIKELANRLATQERDMGAMLAIMSRRDIETAFPDMSEEHLEWIFGMARDNPERSPMEYAKALSDQLEAWGQKTLDEHAKKQEEIKKQQLERVPGGGGIEIFEEDVKFSYDPSRHGEDAKVVSPAQAAMQYMEAALASDEER